jgi:hypothetical protein
VERYGVGGALEGHLEGERAKGSGFRV